MPYINSRFTYLLWRVRVTKLKVWIFWNFAIVFFCIFGAPCKKVEFWKFAVGECFFWYRPTRVVLEQRPLNGCCCCGLALSASLHCLRSAMHWCTVFLVLSVLSRIFLGCNECTRYRLVADVQGVCSLVCLSCSSTMCGALCSLCQITLASRLISCSMHQSAIDSWCRLNDCNGSVSLWA